MTLIKPHPLGISLIYTTHLSQMLPGQFIVVAILILTVPVTYSYTKISLVMQQFLMCSLYQGNFH